MNEKLNIEIQKLLENIEAGTPDIILLNIYINNIRKELKKN